MPTAPCGEDWRAGVFEDGRPMISLLLGCLAACCEGVYFNIKEIGTYFYRLKTRDSMQTHKMTMLK
jgi:hypothetical protein